MTMLRTRRIMRQDGGAAVVFILALLLVMAFVWEYMRPHVLIDNEAVCAVVEGRTLTVTDRSGGKEYIFRRTLVRRSEARKSPYTAVDEPGFKVVLLPGGAVRIEADKVYIIQSKVGRCWHEQESNRRAFA